MVIQPGNDLTSSASQARHKTASQGVSPSPENAPSTSTPIASTEKNVQLSSEAQTIERLEAKITASEGVDSAKVEQIKQQIAEGSYEINSQRLAENIVNQDSLLGG